MLFNILVIVCVLLGVVLMKLFLQLFPYLADSFLRVRGGAVLENNLRLSRDRNFLALAMLLPAVLLMYRYRLYDPVFLQGLPSNLYMLSLLGVLVAYLLIRFLLYQLLKPRRRFDFYRLAHRAGYTYFILLMSLLLATVGILALIPCNDLTIKRFIYTEVLVFYLFFLLRRAQILSRSCNPLRTFLYLCGLEFLPTSLLVLSAVRL